MGRGPRLREKRPLDITFHPMKHSPLLVACALLVTAPTAACDMCGIFLGITPHDRTSSIGLFSRYRLLQRDFGRSSLVKHGDAHEAMARYRESYNTLELRADMWLSQRFSVLAVVPVVRNMQTIDGAQTSGASGLGDPFLLARYAVINSRGNDDTDRTVHRLLLGGGLKFPVGRHTVMFNGEEVDHDLQPGSGSWDLLASAEYQGRRGRWALMLQSIGRYNGENTNGMRSGHGLSSSIDVSYRLWSTPLQARPFAGAYHEVMALDGHGGEPIVGTGCSTLFAQAGGRLWWRTWMLSITAQFPVASDEGDLMLNNVFRGLAGMSWLLPADQAQR